MTKPIEYSEEELRYKSWLMSAERMHEEHALRHVRTLHKMQKFGISNEAVLTNHPMQLINIIEESRGEQYRPAYRADLQQSIFRYKTYLTNKGGNPE